MSQRQEGESHLLRNTLPQPSILRCPGATGAFLSESILVQEGNGGRLCCWEPQPWLGGYSHLPIPGHHPWCTQLEHSWIHPAPWDPEGLAGALHEPWALHSAPTSLHSLGQALHFGGPSHSHLHPSAPGQAATQKKWPSSLPSIAAATEQPWRPAQQHLIYPQLQTSSRHRLNLIKAQVGLKLQCFGSCACPMNFM